MKAIALAMGLMLGAAGCGGGDGDGAAAAASGSGAGGGGGGGSGGAAGSGGAPIVDPHLFDCTAGAIPERVTPVPPECATDPACTTHLVSGHRGAGGELGVLAPEDTLAAVRAAIAIGADFVETDPRPTADGVLVNMHDTTVDRTTDGTGAVDEMTFDEIEQLHIEADEYAGDFSCERVPTIEALLATAKGRVHVLLDGNKTDRVDLFIDAIHATDTLEWAIFDTDDTAKIDEALALEPLLHTQIRVASVAELDDELAHYAGHPPVLVEVHDTSDVTPIVDDIHANDNRALTDAFGTDVAAALGGDYMAYQTYLDLGFDVLQTDRPDLVLRLYGRFPY